jgi:hypothetical protein
MSTDSTRKLTRLQVGPLPLLRSIIARLRLREILLEYLPASQHQPFPRADLLILLAVNLTLAKDPLYELAQWVASLDLRALDYDPRPAAHFGDDRFARALDQLYESNCSGGFRGLRQEGLTVEGAAEVFEHGQTVLT